MRKTKFYKAAELISEDMDFECGCCGALIILDQKLYSSDSKSAKYFENIFHPTINDMNEYNLSPIYWMRKRYDYNIKDINNFRILALLLCHEIYLSENP